MKAKQGFGRLGWAAAVAVCLVLPLVFVPLLYSSSKQLAIMSLRLSTRAFAPLPTVEEGSGRRQSGGGMTELNLDLVGTQGNYKLDSSNENAKPPSDQPNERQGKTKSDLVANEVPILNERQDENKPQVGTETAGQGNISSILDTKAAQMIMTNLSNEKQVPPHKASGTPVQQSKIECDLSEPRSDTCSMLGDIRILCNSSTVILASSSQPYTVLQNSTWKIRPYARKWELPIMEHIKELSLEYSSADPQHTPHCSLNHSIPAVIFSTGGFLGNFFHDFTDVLIPLFVTSFQFQGEVQLLVTDYNSQWIDKYQPILTRLSKYKIINMDVDKSVHCFPEVHVGLKSHKVLGIDPSKSPNGYSMADFRQFLRSCLSLQRETARKIPSQSRKKPRLLVLLRKGSRSITNAKAVVRVARALGYKVITAGPEDTKDMARFAVVVNSCDVMMGVHGAGLANMVFLPDNATLIQVIPWGGLTWACRHDYGEPAPDMGIKYLEYEIREEESSLIEEYPRDHAVFRDPAAIHRQGWNALWSIFLDKQKVKLDVGRLRGVLLGVLQSIKL